MKKVFYIILAIASLLTGCANPESSSRIKADNVTISYGFSSYAMFGAEQAIIDDLFNRFNSLSFKETTDEMDRGSAFYVTFSCKGNRVKNFWVDKKGIFWLDGKTQCYKVSSGSFDYGHLKAIYAESKSVKTGIPFLAVKYGELASEVIDTNFQKEILKNEFLTTVDKMTKPTQENPNLAFSSNPYDYINAHRNDFNRLVAGGESTVDIFVDILKNSTEFGLDKYIMAAVCAEITGIGSGNDKTWASAKEWLQLYYRKSENS